MSIGGVSSQSGVFASGLTQQDVLNAEANPVGQRIDAATRHVRAPVVNLATPPETAAPQIIPPAPTAGASGLDLRA